MFSRHSTTDDQRPRSLPWSNNTTRPDQPSVPSSRESFERSARLPLAEFTITSCFTSHIKTPASPSMENLSLKDRRRRQSIAFASKPDSYDRYFARLPTPEESTPSHRSSDDERRNKVTRRHSPDHPIQSHASGHARPRGDMYFGQGTSQRHVPDSPPYQASDSQKPSLPPLKTVSHVVLRETRMRTQLTL